MKKLCLLLLSIMVLHLNGAIQPTIGTTELMKANGGVGTNTGLRANTIFGTGGSGSTVWSNNITASNLAVGAFGALPRVTFDWLNGRVGLNTNTPAATLEVQGTIRGSSTIHSSGTITSGGGVSIANGGRFSSASRTYLDFAADGEAYFSTFSGGGAIYLDFGTFTGAGVPSLMSTNGDFSVGNANHTLAGGSTNRLFVPGGFWGSALVVTNSTGTPTAAFIGAGNSMIRSSNGVVYIFSTVDGAALVTTRLN